MSQWEEKIALYQERIEEYESEWEKKKEECRRLSRGRLGTFVLFATLGIFYLNYYSLWMLILSLLFLGAFFVFVHFHRRAYEALRHAEDMAQINREFSARLQRKWKEIPLREEEIELPECHYSDDLDLFGRASLFQLLSAVGTRDGKETLAQWLASPADLEEISLRQKGVEELADKLDFRQEAYLRARRTESKDPAPFLDWVESKPYLLPRPFLRWLAPLVAVLMVVLLIADIFFISWGRFWILLLVANIVISIAYSRPIDDIFNPLSERAEALSASRALIEQLEKADWKAERLKKIQKKFQGGMGANLAIKKLQRQVQLIELRRSPIFYIPAQFLFLWDFHMLVRLEKWQIRQGEEIRDWWKAMGEYEALAALSGLAFDEPQWTFADFDTEKEPFLEAEDIGHPLIPRSERVDNSFSLQSEKPVAVITGSNMSGKTTFLRTLGTNIALAEAGGPVCAKTLKLTPFRLRTSIRIRDSLERGISYFMAEVYKIKDVVEAAEKRDDSSPPILFLLDEILHGTNSKERSVAATGIISHLAEEKALGLVTTHDLEIARSEELQDFTTHFHFKESIDQAETQTMSFDYQLRSGIATTTNALKLIRMVGIQIDKKEKNND